MKLIELVREFNRTYDWKYNQQVQLKKLKQTILEYNNGKIEDLYCEWICNELDANGNSATYNDTDTFKEFYNFINGSDEFLEFVNKKKKLERNKYE